MQRRTKEGGKGVGGEGVPDVYLGERQLVFDDSLRLFIGALTSTPLLIDEEKEEADNIYDFLCHPELFFCLHEVPVGRCLAVGVRRGEGKILARQSHRFRRTTPPREQTDGDEHVH